MVMPNCIIEVIRKSAGEVRHAVLGFFSFFVFVRRFFWFLVLIKIAGNERYELG
jgi:hypothetical protein